jgi:N-carbamoylputrescine amidase
MKVALIQQSVTTNKSDNLQSGVDLIRMAAGNGANVICFAELGFEPFYPQVPASEGFEDFAETIPGPITDRLCELAAELGVVILPNLFERAGEKTFDSSPVIDADGSLLGVTRMIHITEYEGFHEQSYYAPGDNGVPVFETRFGKIGIAICYDRHFPEYMRALAVAGAELVVIPQAGTVGEWPEGLYEAEIRVAAFQNGYFAALCNRVGKEEKLDFAGESFICNPSGNVILRAGTGSNEILFAEIDLDEVQQSHAKKLFMRDRRPELYAKWLS